MYDVNDVDLFIVSNRPQPLIISSRHTPGELATIYIRKEYVFEPVLDATAYFFFRKIVLEHQYINPHMLRRCNALLKRGERLYVQGYRPGLDIEAAANHRVELPPNSPVHAPLNNPPPPPQPSTSTNPATNHEPSDVPSTPPNPPPEQPSTSQTQAAKQDKKLLMKFLNNLVWGRFGERCISRFPNITDKSNTLNRIIMEYYVPH